MPVPVRVIKLGGSLFDLADLAARFDAWHQRQPAAADVLVCGGGKIVDTLADWDQLHGLGPTVSHWMCVRAMALNAAWLAAILPRAELCPRWTTALVAAADGRLAVLDPWQFVHEDDPRFSREPLPVSWDVTSDSISARLATLLEASELVLLKSELPAVACSRDEGSSSGYVDKFFAQAAHDLARVRCVNLRDAAAPETELTRTLGPGSPDSDEPA
jgi:aspartokinase-like uncharacterized kinase